MSVVIPEGKARNNDYRLGGVEKQSRRAFPCGTPGEETLCGCRCSYS